ncbi:MAG: insulinase family protein [Hyphomonadaceae bacterium]|nr:insulinase family protein [Hyphomonadaceae bacterium]
MSLRLFPNCMQAGRWVGPALLALAFATVLTILTPTRALAMKIQEITSPGGIKAWLVEERSVPIIALRFAFEGGSAQDPAGKEGVANFLAGMLDEGAGDLNAKQYQERMEDIAMRMGFDDGRDSFYGSFETLTENRDRAVELLALAINKPRFDVEAVERIRAQLLAGLAAAQRDPTRVAADQWMALAFAGHPYGRPANGTPQSVAKIGKSDLAEFRARVFAKDMLRVAVVGDIDAKTLGGMLDTIFGGLPTTGKLVPVPRIEPKAGQRLKVLEMNVPQSVARFGLPAMPRQDKDFMAAFVLNNIIGGGFTSRLYAEVRDKRGLAYGVDTTIVPLRHASVFVGNVATKNEEIGQSLELIRSEFKRVVTEGVTEVELADAKSYLTGSFALRFDTSANIANQLLWTMVEGLGPDYLESRNSMINAVTLEDVKRVAKRLFEGKEPIVTVVGKPKGLMQGG